MLSAAEGIASLIRKRNGGVLSATSFAAAVTHFRKDVLDAADFVKLSADNTLIMAAILLLDRHPINSADSIVLQATLDMATIERSGGNDVILVASDQRLLRAAQAEGIVTFDPETQTQTNLDALIGP
jgi:hypothetical protein